MIALGLNCILGFLLVCGLLMGMKLDKRLRGLRDSHAGFAKAVQELDSAAARTEASLADLRAGTEHARTELAARIDQARLLTQRLDTLTAEAARALEQPLALTQPLSQPPEARPLADSLAARAAARAEREAALRPTALSQREPAARREPSPRSKVMVDDDLFEIVSGPERRAPLAAVMGGRR
ncbi:MAG: flagellar positioning protein PflI [Caulobacteraceae bacterium]|jgi:hypothetical protein|nr:flagellar positioning protein PflI [Caulobacteraceae bacterium]